MQKRKKGLCHCNDVIMSKMAKTLAWPRELIKEALEKSNLFHESALNML